MWHSEADIINDLAALNDFGEPGHTEPYRILCSVGRGSKAKNESPPQPLKMLDPRTGEEIDVSGDCPSSEDLLCRSVGRGSVLVSRNYSLLHKQLRLARPFGSGDEIIESYYKYSAPNKVEASPSDVPSEKSSDEKSSVQTRSRVKAVRNSNFVKNALMASLLKAKEISAVDPEVEKSIICSESEVLGRSVTGCGLENGEVARNGIGQIDCYSDNPFGWEYSEDSTSESACDSKTSIREGIKGSADERFKFYRNDLSEDFNFNLSFNAKNEDDYAIKNESGIRNILDCKEAEEARKRNEIYRKLGERMNKNQVIPNKSRNAAWRYEDEPNFKSLPKEFMYEESDFPPLL